MRYFMEREVIARHRNDKKQARQKVVRRLNNEIRQEYAVRLSNWWRYSCFRLRDATLEFGQRKRMCSCSRLSANGRLLPSGQRASYVVRVRP